MGMDRKPTLPTWKIYGYGVGEFGFNFFLVFIAYHLMFFLTDVAKFPTAIAATIYTLLQWLETFSLLASGYIIDRSKICKGKYGPWLIIGSVTSAVGMVLFFTKFNLPVGLYAIVFSFCYLIAYWGYNFMWVSYRSIMGLVAKNQIDNVALTTAASQMGTVSMIVFSFVGTRILYGFDTIAKGYTTSAFIYGLLMLLSMFIVYQIVKPYDNHSTFSRISKKQSARVILIDAIQTIRGPMLFFYLAFVFRTCVQMVIPALIVYHFNYVLKNPAGMQLYLILYTVAQLLGLFFVRFVTARFGKRNTFIASSLSTFILLCAAWLVNDRIVPFLGLMSINAFVTIFGASLLPAFLTDIADHNEYKLGLNNRSQTISVGATSITVASILGGGIASFGLAFIGYDSSLTVQPPAVASSITNFMMFVGAFFALASVLPMLFYKLDDRKTTEKDKIKRTLKKPQVDVSLKR